MHFKKIVAGFLSASILATTAIVAPVTVSAEEAEVLYTNTPAEADNYVFEGNFFDYVTEAEAAEIATVEYTFTVEGAWSYANASFGYNMGADPWWSQSETVELSDSTGEEGATVSKAISIPATSVRVSGDGPGYFKLGFYINAGTTVTISDFTLLNSDGKVLYPVAVEEDVEEEEPISGETEKKTITYEQVDDATAATESCGYSDAKGSTEDSKTYAQVSDNTTWRIYKLVSLEELKGKTSASVFVMNNNTGKVVKLTTKVVYQKLNDTTAALEGYAYVVFVIENVTNTFDNSGSYFTSDLMWSDIILN